MAETERFMLSNFGIRYFIEDIPADNSIPTATHEIEAVTTSTLGVVEKDVKTYRTLNGDGWEIAVPLGQAQPEATMSCLRMGKGDVYTGTDGSSTFTRIKNWVLESTKRGGSTAPKVILEAFPRGDDTYEGTAYYVIPKSFNPAERNTEDGQEFSFTVKPYGPMVPLAVTYNDVNDTFTFAKISSVNSGGDSMEDEGETP